MNQTVTLSQALLNISAKAENSLAPSARGHLRSKSNEDLVLRVLMGLCSMERETTLTPQASPLLSRLT